MTGYVVYARFDNQGCVFGGDVFASYDEAKEYADYLNETSTTGVPWYVRTMRMVGFSEGSTPEEEDTSVFRRER